MILLELYNFTQLCEDNLTFIGYKVTIFSHNSEFIAIARNSHNYEIKSWNDKKYKKRFESQCEIVAIVKKSCNYEKAIFTRNSCENWITILRYIAVILLQLP